MTTREETEVRVGQKWRDRDRRMSSGGRIREVVAIEGDRAVMGGENVPAAMVSRVRIANLRKRWRLEP